MGPRAVNQPSSGGSDARYLLGHTERELERLDIQDALYRDVTQRTLSAAGIAAGMRVLDIGCGTGGVALTAAELVGPAGFVVGIDRGPGALDVARRHAAARQLKHVEFRTSEIEEFAEREPFDAVTGRFVLMHQPDPVDALRAATSWVRPGGVVAVIESYMEILRAGAHSEPHSALYDQIVRFKCDVVRGAGADLRAGGRLRRTLLDAGLFEPNTRLEARLEGGADSPYYRYVAESVRSMLPEAARLGIPTFDEEAADDLEDRLRVDVMRSGGVLVVWPVVCGWARK
jgi:ubiquinone/menaquinone biosynthesis C-methylase UbiE